MNDDDQPHSNDDLFTVARSGEDQEDWMLSFVDLITLLMGCFVIMYTLKSADVSKHEQMSQSIHEAVGDANPKQIEKLDYTDFYQTISDYIKSEGLEANTQIRLTKVGVEISTEGSMLFEPGSADLNDNSQNLIAKIASSLMHEPFFIQIEGHTDSAPIATSQYPTNWELSAARAARVARLLISLGIEPTHLNAVGYADTRLLYPDQPLHAGNRRVVFVVSKI
ncbi:MAG: OmpA family protein [Methylobacter sp.]|nr:OmpA family protein [Methylobacter sp.]